MKSKASQKIRAWRFRFSPPMLQKHMAAQFDIAPAHLSALEAGVKVPSHALQALFMEQGVCDANDWHVAAIDSAALCSHCYRSVDDPSLGKCAVRNCPHKQGQAA